MLPLVSQLTAAHPLHKRDAQHWGLLSRLVDGGRSVTIKDKQGLLRHPDNRPEPLKEKRAEVAHHSPLLSSLVTLVGSHITHTPATYKPYRLGTTTVTGDEFWSKFQNSAAHDPDSDFPSFHGQLSQALLYALAEGVTYLQVDTPRTPETKSRQEQNAMAGDEPFLVLRHRQEVIDWQSDREGFTFAKICTQESIRDDWKSHPTPAYRYQIYTRKPDGVITSQSWRILPKNKEVRRFIPRQDDKVVAIGPSEEFEIFHALSGQKRHFKFPLVKLAIPQLLQLGPQLFDTYRQYFTQTAAINYASLSSLWHQLVFTGVTRKTDIAKAIGRGAGEGFYWELPEGVDVRWLETETKNLDFALRYAEALRESLFERVSQIAVSAAMSPTSLARSGKSKEEDRLRMEKLLRVYGGIIRNSSKKVLDCAAIARGELLDWQVHGFDKFDSQGLLDDLEEYQAAEPVINSPTFTFEGRKAIAASAITALGLPPQIVAEVSREIEQDRNNQQAN
ncbi:MAG: hypothetical protein F6J87_06045 [Spirulina sp. SIO3F2]|nr:hypothetical protein [Spirulina sp. SIO3F2]